ncbi:MAG: NUDIX domain-containing protein [Hyphomicrobiales bacterium]
MNARHIVSRVIHGTVGRKYLRWKRGLTLGARTIVIDKDDRVLLVKQSYAPGWILPGGGVEFGETCEEAARRELHEEAAVTPKGPFLLHGVFSNHTHFPGDHLVVYVLREFAWSGFTPTMEILEAKFFAAKDMPHDVQASSLRRIEELWGKRPIGLEW